MDTDTKTQWYAIREHSQMTSIEYLTGDRFEGLRARDEHLATGDEIEQFLATLRRDHERIEHPDGYDLIFGESRRIEIRRADERV